MFGSKKRQRDAFDYYLVQRLRHSPYEQAAGRTLSTPKGRANPFGGGRMGDYELEYMGAAEFELGAVGKANNRLAAAGKDLRLAEFSYRGHDLDFLWIGSEGEPFDTWTNWADGRNVDPRTGTVREIDPFFGKEPPYELQKRLRGDDPPQHAAGQWQTAVWWALDGNVMWAFNDEHRHLHQLLESMGTAPTELLR